MAVDVVDCPLREQGGGSASASRRSITAVMAEMKKVTWPDVVARAAGRDRRHHPLRCSSASSSRIIDVVLQHVLVQAAFPRSFGGADAMDHRWYAIQTTSGHENKVRSLIQRDRRRSAPGRGAGDPPGARADPGSGRDQERQEGERRAEDLPGLRARRDGDGPGDGAHDQRHPGRDQVRRARARPQPLRPEEK